jgi:hypothetical protein
MIKASDLRILNKVSCNSTDLTVKAIEFNSVGNNYYIKVFENYQNYLLEFLEPTPLTEELLLQFGFVSNPYQDRYEKDGIHVQCDKTKGETLLWIEGFPHVKYVHKLQNFYYENTNQELTKIDKK